jgi:PST family polysaccharide transporter
MPMLSRLAKQPKEYRRAYLGMVEKLNMVVMPCAAMLIAMPDQIVRALFGPAWSASSPIVAWLGVAALYHPIAYTCSWLFMTQDRSREMLAWGVVGSALSAVTIVAGLPFGAEGVAATFAVGGLVLRLPCLFWMVGRRGPVSAWDLARSLGPSSMAATLVVATLVGLRHLPAFDALNLARSLSLSGLSMAVVALLCFACVPRSRQALREFVRLTETMGRGRNA